MRIDEGKLRAYLDQALSPEALAEVKQQLADSPEAQAALARLRAERDDFTPYLAVLAPPPGERPNAARAWRRWQSRLAGQSTLSTNTVMRERIKNMFSQFFLKRYQPALVILAIVAITTILFSFAPVRAVAGNLLKIFRVQTVRILPVDSEHVKSLENDPRFQGLMDELEPQIKVLTDSEPERVDSLAEAAEMVGFPVVQITALPDGLNEPDRIMVYRQKVAQVQLDKELLEALFEAAEIEISLPDSLNEEPILITQPNTVIQEWQQEGQRTLEFVQMTTPQIQYPDDLDLNALGVAGLQLLGMSKEEASQLGATINWADTLILPIPKNGQLTATEVSINGANGFLFTAQAKDEESAVMWPQAGMTYFVNGNYAAEQTIEMAESVK
ncbi:MAG: hypothetical protein JW953_18185 [Anaerolineae bacterium]|nr:hypothetical protein [Anaerolineae bacterium]